MASYVVVNKAGSKLSGHYPNAAPGGKLVFRRGDWYTFGTKREAEDFLRSITRRGYGKNLRIRSR